MSSLSHAIADGGHADMSTSEYPETESSIERNRQWNQQERRKVARRMMDETIDTIVSIMDLSRPAISAELDGDMAGIETMAQLLKQFGEDKCRRWFTVLAAEKRRAEGEAV